MFGSLNFVILGIFVSVALSVELVEEIKTGESLLVTSGSSRPKFENRDSRNEYPRLGFPTLSQAFDSSQKMVALAALTDDVSSLLDDFKELEQDYNLDFLRSRSDSGGTGISSNNSESSGTASSSVSSSDEHEHENEVDFSEIVDMLNADLGVENLLDGIEVHPEIKEEEENQKPTAFAKSEIKSNKRTMRCDDAEEPENPVVPKRKRRKRAKTAEEKRQRAIERRIKNRESAMRSRQRVLNQVKETEERVAILEEENAKQEAVLEQTQKKLSRAEQENLRLREELRMLRSLHSNSQGTSLGSCLATCHKLQNSAMLPTGNDDCYNDKAVIGAVKSLFNGKQAAVAAK
uniref:BZIP domain-containing protein n=1 Tax=Prorocentrum micans TaxID=2945 RepID=A0A7S2TAC6_PROMC|mmetsp:Transcript_12769/g.14521  ORF Transcript_12769/g.14521 Transcript_12769/m.14521 type:complete len:348 (+) Transcript_12769:230-1273(+)